MSAFLAVRPSVGAITSPFGPRPKPTPLSPARHGGQDYGWRRGTRICAAAAGRIVHVGWTAAATSAALWTYGTRIVIDHGAGRQTWYCHLAATSVRVGQEVAAGDLIGEMGATGNVTAKHLHFEVRIHGVQVDPEPLFSTNREEISMSNIAGAVWDATDYDPDDGDIGRLGNRVTRTDEIMRRLTGFTPWKDVRALWDLVWGHRLPTTRLNLNPEIRDGSAQPTMGEWVRDTGERVEVLAVEVHAIRGLLGSHPIPTAPQNAAETIAALRQNPELLDALGRSIAREFLAARDE